MRIVPSTLAATSDEAPTSQLHLTKLVYDGISRIKENGKCLQHCFSRFHEISGFASLQDWESVFTETSFTHRTSVTTPYGVINSYDITHRLKQNLISRNPSLRQLCIAAVCEVGPPLMTVDILLSLPQNLFQMFFITAFSIHWIPMSHTQFHGDLDKTRKIPSSLWHVLKILSIPQVFERLFDECREVLMFIVCWMQHAHFSPNRDDTNYQPCSDPRDPPNRPILEPHQFSEKLVRVLKKKLAPLTQANDSVPPSRGGLLTTADSVISCLLFGLKVSHFLCDSSEYVHAVRAVRLTRNFLQTVTDERTRLWLDHELYCIMLRSMNSHIMYAERENQLVFQRDVPRLLKSLYQSNLLVSQSDPQKPFSCLALPYAPTTDLNRFDSVEIVGVSTPSTRCSQVERKNRKPGTSVNSRGSMLGPSGDTISSVTFGPTHRFFHGKSLNGGFLYAQLATYHYAMCAYEKSFQFSVLAIEQIRACSNNPPGVSGHVVVEVLRVVCKLCMIKREYKLALAIIKSALSFTSHVYGSSNLTYANLLLDYGCLLLNADKTRKAAQVYATAFALIFSCLPGSSVLCALALEAIAYAHYVLEYTTGDFNYASKCADAASQMLHQLKHHDCMQTASASRVQALIVEEIAIDANDPHCFKMAEELHIRSLKRCLKTYGEHNIQTAKHYGNLGRLYQSMQSYTKAEQNHKKAIDIKTSLLGDSDFEVGLSLGHLASLYNYDMKRYSEAEQLHLRSISISQKVFGPTYSGLEYEYRGLQRVYHQLGLPEKKEQYTRLLQDWRMKREQADCTETTDQPDEIEPSETEKDFHAHLTDILCLLSTFEEEFSKLFGVFSHCGGAVSVSSDSNNSRSTGC